MQQTSLKAVKQATKAPSKVLFILSDSVKLALSGEVVTPILQAYDATVAKEQFIYKASENLARILGTKPTFELWDTAFAYIEQAIITGRKVGASTAINYLVDIRNTLKSAFALEKPAKASGGAMAESRAKLQALSDSELKAQVDGAIKAENFKQAVTLQNEVKRRKQAIITQAKKQEGKATTALRNDLKKWISEGDTQLLAMLVWVKSNPDQVMKLVKS